MKPESFAKATDKLTRRLLRGEASRIILGVTEGGQQLAVYHGKLKTEPAQYIGHYVIMAPPADERKRTPWAEAIAVGDQSRVRHPSYDSVLGREGWYIASSIGTIVFPPEVGGEETGLLRFRAAGSKKHELIFPYETDAEYTQDTTQDIIEPHEPIRNSA